MNGKLMLFDTHAHFNDKRFDDDRDEVIGALKDAGVGYVLNAAYSVPASKSALKLADKYPFIYASAGVHPHDAKTMTEDTIAELEELLKHPKAVAVGEIGLDYHYSYSPRDVQKVRFCEQLEMARRVGKPVIIHMREATSETLEIVSGFKELSYVFHCFPGSWETAKTILDAGWYLSFTGVVTFKKAERAADVVKKMPLERLMLETDCPYMSPEPHRGERNSSLFLPFIAKKIADIRGISVDEVAAATTENAKRFFGIRDNLNYYYGN